MGGSIKLTHTIKQKGVRPPKVPGFVTVPSDEPTFTGVSAPYPNNPAALVSTFSPPQQPTPPNMMEVGTILQAVQEGKLPPESARSLFANFRVPGSVQVPEGPNTAAESELGYDPAPPGVPQEVWSVVAPQRQGWWAQNAHRFKDKAQALLHLDKTTFESALFQGLVSAEKERQMMRQKNLAPLTPEGVAARQARSSDVLGLARDRGDILTNQMQARGEASNKRALALKQQEADIETAAANIRAENNLERAASKAGRGQPTLRLRAPASPIQIMEKVDRFLSNDPAAIRLRLKSPVDYAKLRDEMFEEETDRMRTAEEKQRTDVGVATSPNDLLRKISKSIRTINNW